MPRRLPLSCSIWVMPRAGKDDQIIFGFHRGDEHEVVPLDRRLNHRADIDDRRIAADQRLRRHLSAAKKDRLDFQAVLVEKSHLFGDPNIALAKAERRVTDLDPLERLGVSRGRGDQVE